MQKKCKNCKILKDSSDFHLCKGSKDGLQNRCKPCAIKRATEHYLHHKHDFKCRTKKLTDLYKHTVGLIKEQYGCFNCGLKNYKCLDFHHTNPLEKDFSVSTLTSCKSTKNIVNEINKCIVTCSNCHRLIHYGDLLTDITKKCSISVEEFNIILSDNKQSFGIQNEIYRPRLDGFVKKEYYCNCGKKISRQGKRCRSCVDKTKIQWPTKEEFEKLIWQIPSSVIAKQLNCADTAIVKFCKRNKIQKPPRGYWQKKKYIKT